MSFLIKGGYYTTINQVLNISLRRTDKWVHGFISVKANSHRISPEKENVIEFVKHGDMHALLLNNCIIYEDKKLFTYNLDLQGCQPLVLNDSTLYDFLDCNYVEYCELKHINMMRCLN